MIRRSAASIWVLYGGVTALSLLWLVPVMSTLMTSIRPLDEIRDGWWNFDDATFTINNYVRAWDQGLSSFVLNSFVITFGSVAVTVTLGTLAAYAFVHLRFQFRRVW